MRARYWAGRAVVLLALCTPVAGRGAQAQPATPHSTGATGGDSSNKNTTAAGGGAGGALSYTNTTPFSATFNGGNNQPLEVYSLGGNAGSGTGNNTNGGTGGAGGSIAFTNQAAVSLTAPDPATNGGRLVTGVSAGGNGGSSKGGTPGGGGGGSTVSVINDSTVSLNWNWAAPPGTDLGLAGVIASSEGGAGGPSNQSKVNGGAGGAGGLVDVTVNQGASVSVASQNYTGTTGSLSFQTPAGLGIQNLIGAAVAAVTRGGTGGLGYDSSNGGAGGAAGDTGISTLVVNNALITVTSGSNYVAGLVAEATGGTGGGGGNEQDHSNGGAGGLPGEMSLTIGGSGTSPANVTTGGTGAPAILVASNGGAGGPGTNYTNFSIFGAASGGNGGAGSRGDQAVATLNTNTLITTTGAQSSGVLATSAGGAGGTGGYFNAAFAGFGGNGGAGGAGDPVSVTVNGNAGIQTSGSNAYGVFAQSIGGAGGAGGYASAATGSGGGNGGSGGAGGTVTVNVTQGARITTSGSGASGIVAQSVGGIGGAGGMGSGSLGNSAGSAGNAGGTGTVSVGNAGTIITSGDNAVGILAQALSGVGGQGGTSNGGLFYSGGGNGGAGVSSGPVGVTNSGGIATSGANADAIEAQSISGGGGNAGDASGLISFGGSGGGASNGGDVTVTNTGSLTTTGQTAEAIFAHSVGGGGGTAGTAGGAVALGGGSADAGSGATVQVTVGGMVRTAGENAIGVVAQSVGGGGGGAGNAGGAITIGGSGGAGGGGGTVTVTQSGTLLTTGDGGTGILAQSVGGGGGVGGSAAGAINLGRTNGGNAGSGGGVTVGVGGSLSTQGASADGVLAQSIGGGGGAGGAQANLLAVGGGGGGSGNGGTVDVTVSGGIQTTGSGSNGVVAQSVGGGGGAGGDAAGAISLGGIGGNSGTGGDVTVTVGGSITTAGQSANGVLAQSIGGGGGAGGNAGALIALGGSGGAPGYGQGAAVTLSGSVTTTGELANGVVAQSIGGGGGNGGNATSYSAVVGVSVGGSGVTGGDGGKASVTGNPGASISVAGANAAGVVAQSIGGGGGSGGAGDTITGGIGFAVSAAVGGSGGSGGLGGGASVSLTGTRVQTGLSIADATNPDSVTTSPTGASYVPLTQQPVNSYGVVAQSVGGGGGIAGSASAQSVVANVPIPETDSSVGVSLSFGVGGSGGSGGNGGSATVNLTDGTSISTQGNGAHGVVAQSTGGGGGLGGDSSALASTWGFKDVAAVTGRAVWTADIGFSLGGAGGQGGTGGAVAVYAGGTAQGPDAAGSSPVTISTTGGDADGIFAQSVGGGGGNGGFGSSSTKNLTSSWTNLSFSAALGGRGGSGGTGGTVDVTLYPGASVSTLGSGAMGIFAQSVGGGGGASQGNSFSLGLPTFNDIAGALDDTYKGPFYGGTRPSITINAGTDGGTGGNGQAVAVTVQGHITTAGQDAAGVFAQSVGGGGGAAGDAGSDGSSDSTLGNIKAPFDAFFTYLGELRSQAKENGLNSGSITSAFAALFPGLNISLSFGATGGGGGDGGAVNLNVEGGTIATTGDYAEGAVAQSVGGGGGKGGAAIAGGPTGLGNLLNVNLNFALGGSGGAGGAGGAANVDLSGATISTQGFWAFGVLGQSVGGGGGLAGSDQTYASGIFSLGVSSNGGGGGGGNGGGVTLTGGSLSSVSTAGDGAHAVFLQSVGGGGGVVSAGTSISPGVFGFFAPLTIKLGAGSGAAGNGGTVSIDDAPLRLATSGGNAFGILAQSIGGGGGIAGTNPGTPVSITPTGNTNSYTNGGTVNLTLGSGSTITTTGDGSSAIVAQSIGGGGGIGGYASGASTLNRTPPTGTLQVTHGNGGAVTINTGTATITTTGAAAHGIFAQSIGAGGGIASNGNDGVVHAGSFGAAGSAGLGALVTVTQAGTLSATGTNSVGIYAQSVGQASGGNPSSGGVQVTINGQVMGGSGAQGWGVWTDTDYVANKVNIGATGTLGAANNNAIVSNGFGITNVDNYGTVTGNADLHSGNATAGTFTNESGATFNEGTVTGNVVNDGTITMLDPPLVFGASTVNGTFTQNPGGTLVFNTDFNTRSGDTLTLNGATSLAGHIQIVPQSLLPYRGIGLITLNGPVTLDGITVNPGVLVGYGLARAGNTLSVSATSADFAPAAFGLNKAQRAVAQGLLSVWNAGGTPDFGTLFAHLEQYAERGPLSYGSQIGALSPDGLLAVGARLPFEAQAFADTLLNCSTLAAGQIIEGDHGCAWMRVIGGGTQGGGDGISSYGIDTVAYQLGGRTEVAPDWYLNGALAYQIGMLSTSGGVPVSGNGDAGYGGLAIERETGPWDLAAGLSGSVGSWNLSRMINFDTIEGLARSSPSTETLGGRLEAAYRLDLGALYVRPDFALDVIYARTGATSETLPTGTPTTVALSMGAADETVVIGTPSVEIGRGLDAQTGLPLRVFADAGLSVLSQGGWNVGSVFQGAPAGTGRFTTSVPLGNVVGRLAAGAQLTAWHGIDLRLEYIGAFAGPFTSNGGLLSVSARF